MGNHQSASSDKKNINRKKSKINSLVNKSINSIDKQSTLPDFAEINRLQMQHYLFRHVFDGNYSAPGVNEILETGGKILDVG